MEHLTELALQSSVVSIACGLDLTRDVATHFLQQRLLASQVELARRIHLPLVIREKGASDKVIEAIGQAGSSDSSGVTADGQSDWQLRVAIHSFSGSDAQLTAYVAAGFYVMLNGQICDLRVDSSASSRTEVTDDSDQPAAPLLLPELAGDGASLFRQLRCGLLPIERLLLCSDAPLHTPQNIEDVYIRSQRNEPANLSFVYDIVAKAYRLPLDQLVRHLEHNTRTFYQLHYKPAETADDSKQPVMPVVDAAGSDAQQQQHTAHSEQVKAYKSGGQANGSSHSKKQLGAAIQQLAHLQIGGAEQSTAHDAQPRRHINERRRNSGDGSSEEASQAEEASEDGEAEAEAEQDERVERTQRTAGEQRSESSTIEEESEDEEESESGLESEGSGADQAGVILEAAGRRNRYRQGDAESKGGNKHRRRAAATDTAKADTDTTSAAGRRQSRQPKQSSLKHISGHRQSESGSEEKEAELEVETEEQDSEDRGSAAGQQRPAHPLPLPPQQSTMQQQQGSTGRRHRVSGPSASSGATSSSRHRLVGGEVDLSLDRDILRYACRRCRTVLFSEDDVIPHASSDDTAKSISTHATAASASSASASMAGSSRKKASMSAADLTHCESTFIRPMVWMRNIATSSATTSSTKLSAVLVNSERIECPCGAKLGRCGMVALYIPCSCGRLCDGPPPYFTVHRSRVDVIDRSALRQTLAAPRAVDEQWTETQREAEEEERMRQLSKRERDRLKRDNKRVKRQTRDDQRGNFSEFRNKTLVHAKSKADADNATNKHATLTDATAQ